MGCKEKKILFHWILSPVVHQRVQAEKLRILNLSKDHSNINETREMATPAAILVI